MHRKTQATDTASGRTPPVPVAARDVPDQRDGAPACRRREETALALCEIVPPSAARLALPHAARASAGPRRRRMPALTATLLSALLTTTISLTMDRSPEDLVTLALHYPLFLVIAFSVSVAVPPRGRSVLCLVATPLLAAEIVAIRAL